MCSGYTRLEIKFYIIDIWQGSEYASSSKYTSVTQGSVENNPSYIFVRFLSILWALNMLGLKYTRFANKPRLYMILCKVYFKILSIFKVLSFEYANDLNGSGA